MATITKTIGTSSRDYSTITAWEADLDNGAIYSASDDAVGECYNDSTFTENVTFNGGGTIGLGSALLTVAEGERHDGTAGTGVVVTPSAAGNIINQITPSTGPNNISWLELDGGGYTGASRRGISVGSSLIGGGSYTSHCLIYNITTTTYYYSCHGIRLSSWQSDYNPQYINNCIIYNLINTGSGGTGAAAVWNGYMGDWINYAYNCVAYNITHASQRADGFYNNNVKNSIAMGCDGSDFNTGYETYCMDSDGSSSGTTGSLNNKSAVDQFVSIVYGSEDLHIKAGSDAIGAGTDLGTTAGVNIDINGRDRDANVCLWNMCAHYLP